MSGVQLGAGGGLSGVSALTLKDVAAPANPGAGLGSLYKKTGDGGIFWKPDAAGPEVNLTAPAVIGGALISQVSSDAVTTFDSLGSEAAAIVNQVKLTMTTPSLAAGTYKLTYQADIGTSLAVSSSQLISDIIFNGVTVATMFSTIGGAPTRWSNYNGFIYLTLTAGSKVGTINYRSTNPPFGGVLHIRNARMELVRIS